MDGTEPVRDEVRIRAVQDSDIEPFFAHQREPEATEMAAFPARDRVPFFTHWARIRAEPTSLLRTIVAGGEVAGNIVSWTQSGHREVGYWLARSHWGRGVATKALALFLAEETARPLVAHVAVHNVGSIRVLEKCGFQRAEATEFSSATADLGDIEEVPLVLRA